VPTILEQAQNKVEMFHCNMCFDSTGINGLTIPDSYKKMAITSRRLESIE